MELTSSSINLGELFLGDYVSLDTLPVPINRLSLNQQLELYQKELEAKISNHDQEIEQMCSAQYKSFIDCIQELLLVRPSADVLKQETVEINAELTKSTDTLQRKAEELIKARRILVNSSSSIELITKCIFVLEQYSKFKQQLEEKKYFPALKTLESLDREYLPSVLEYKFAVSIRELIPKYRSAIKEATTKDLNDFLEGLLVKSQEIGEIVLRSAATQQNFEDYNHLFRRDSYDNGIELRNLTASVYHSPQFFNNYTRTPTITASPPTPTSPAKKSTKTKRAPPAPCPIETTPQTTKNNKSRLDIARNKNNASDINFLSMIDFCPVYRGLHIFSNLGFREEFDAYYKEQRQKQSKLAFNPPSSMNQSISSYHDYFSSVIGFFVIEDHLMGTTKDFIHPEYLDDLWQSCIQSMSISMEQQAKQCHDTLLMLKIKKLIMLFIFTIKTYGHKTEALGGILVTIRQQYNDLLMRQWKEKFEEIFRIDNYQPFEVNNMEEYLQTVGAMGFLKTDNVIFPKKLPFSLFVPKIYEEVRRFIEQSLKFSQDLNSSQADVQDMVRRSTNQLLVEVLGPCLTNLINKSSLLEQLIQITINTDHLEKAMQGLDHYIKYQVSKSMSGSSDAISDEPIKLQGESMFKDARAEAETQIYKKLNDKIDDFFSIANYDWTLPERLDNGQASSFISELIKWLREKFRDNFANLPQRIAQGACMSACKHLAQSLRDILLSDESKSLSMGGLDQFNLDLMQCELFAGSEPVPGFREGDLQMAFAELRQICDLFLDEDYQNYIADMGKQQNKYLRVTVATALNICEKMREHDKKKSYFGSKKTEKQNVRDSFLKVLRQQSVHSQQ